MRKSKQGYKGILIFIIVMITFMMLFLGFRSKEGSRFESVNYNVEFNSAEKRFIDKCKKEDRKISVFVDEELRYLMKNGDDNYLTDYINRLLSPSELEVVFEEDKDKAMCRLCIVTDDIRAQQNDIMFTTPIFQIKGKLYINRNHEEKPQYTGVVVDDRLKRQQLDRIEYDDNKIDWIVCETMAEVVKRADEVGADFLLGDENAMDVFLEETSQYTGINENIYSRNVCIITDKKDAQLNSIINQSIHSMNRKLISYNMSEMWLDGDGPLYMEDDYGDVYALIIIIFFAVFVAFYIYYLSNKNLYYELSDRMNKLTESKREFQTTFRNVSYYMAEIDKEGIIMDINKALYDFADENIVGKNLWDFLDCDESDLENEIKMKNKTLAVKLFPIEESDKLLFMAMDVTRERMAERQLLQDNKMIAIGQLAAGVAHEIRNPLGIIRNYCYVLKNMDDEDIRKKAIEQIEKSVENSSAIINSLLDFSRVSAGTLKEIDVAEHINSLALINGSLFKKKNIEFRLKSEEQVVTPVIVESLDMVLINLISNGVDAMDNNGVLTITLLSDDDYFEIVVEDTGKGISEEEMDEMFNPFFTTKAESGGTGLGLYIVYNEIQKMNGRISVDSKVGVGTKFTLTLPRNQEAEEND